MVRGERGIWVGTGRMGDKRSGSGIRSSKTDQKAKIRTRNTNVIEMKQGFLEMRMGQGGRSSGMGLHRV